MSRLFYWALPLVACAMLYGVFWVYRYKATVTTESLLAEIEVNLGKRTPDTALVLEKLDRALQMTRAAGDREAEGKVIRRRAEYYQSLGRWDRAVADMRHLLAEYAPNDAALTLTLANFEANTGHRDVALGRLDELIERVPRHPNARQMRADLMVQYGDEVLARADEICRSVMDDRNATRAREASRQITVLDGEDLRRLALHQEVNSMFPLDRNDDRTLYNDAINRASVIFDSAYADYALALDRSSDIPIIEGLIEILSRGYKPEDAVDFALATQPRLMTSTQARVYQNLARVLASTGRIDEAGAVITRFSAGGKALETSYLEEWMDLAYKSEQWTALGQAAKLVREKATGWADWKTIRSNSLFYTGYSSFRGGQFPAAISALRLYTEGEVVAEPFPGALSLAYGTHADCAATLTGKHWRQEEGEALLKSLLLRKDAAPVDWLRLHELQRETTVEASDRELVLAHLMASVPDRAASFDDAWRRAGREVMDTSRLNITQVREQLNRRGRLIPNEDIGSFAFYLLADHYSREREWLGSYAACREVLEQVPFHSPTLDIFVRSCAQLGRVDEAIDVLIERQKFLGGHQATREVLARNRERMTNTQVRDLMRNDPVGFGRQESLDWLIEHGRHEEALRALESLSFKDLTAYERTCLGEALLGLGRHAEAINALRRIPVESPSYPRAFRAFLRAAIESGDRRVLDVVLTGLVVPETPVGGLLVDAIDSLLFAGAFEPARRVAEFLDSSASTRSGTNLMRLAAIYLGAGLEAETRDTLERAHAFRPDGGAPLGHVIANAVFERWNDLAASVAELNAEGVGLSANGMMAGALLSGRKEMVATLLGGSAPLASESDGIAVLLRGTVDVLEGKRTVLVGLPDAVRMETLQFLEGTLDAPRDPRHALAIVLALENPDWLMWAIQAAREDRKSGLTLWPDLLEAEALFRLGRFRAADGLIARLIHNWPKFLPSWALGTRMATQVPRNDAELAEFAAKGWTSAASPQAVAARQPLAEVRRLRAEGQPGAALLAARDGLAISLKDPALLYESGLCYEELGRYEEALVAMRSFLVELSERARDAALPGILAMLNRGLDSRKMTPAQWNANITQLQESFPDSALLVVYDAQRELRIGLKTNPVVGVFRAFTLLDRFRARRPGQSLESLGMGALEAWHRFYLALDPRRGESLLESELELDPRSVDLRIMLAESLVAQNRFDDALAELELLADMIPDERALVMWTRLRARGGAAPAVIAQGCLQIASFREPTDDDPELRWIEAIGKANGNRSQTAEGAAMLEELWGRRAEFDKDFRVAVGRAAAVAMIRVGDDQMTARAQAILTELSEMRLPVADRRLYATMSRIGPNPSGADILAGRKPKARPEPPPTRTIEPGMPVVKARPQQKTEEALAAEQAALIEAEKERRASMSEEELKELRSRRASITPAQRKALAALLKGKSEEEVEALREKLEAMTPEEREAYLQQAVKK